MATGRELLTVRYVSIAADQDHGGLPHLAAGSQRTEFERRPLVVDGRSDQCTCQLERSVGRVGDMGVAVSEQRRAREPHTDEMGDLGIHRRGESRGERRDHLVGLVTPSLDRQRPARLDVDQDVGTGGRDPELDERHARHADLAGIVAQQLDRNIGGQPPVVLGTRPWRRQIGRSRQT